MTRIELVRELRTVRSRIETSTGMDERSQLKRLTFSLQRKLAELDAGRSGASLEQRLVEDHSVLPDRGFLDCFERSKTACMLLDPRAGLHIVDVNDTYAAATLVDRRMVVGSRLFDIFPDNPGDPLADGVSSLFDSLRAAALTGRPDRMEVQRYDVRGASGEFVPRFWQCVNEPVFDAAGNLKFLLHTAVDITEDTAVILAA